MAVFNVIKTKVVKTKTWSKLKYESDENPILRLLLAFLKSQQMFKIKAGHLCSAVFVIDTNNPTLVWQSCYPD